MGREPWPDTPREAPQIVSFASVTKGNLGVISQKEVQTKSNRGRDPKDVRFQKDVGAFRSAVSEVRHYAVRAVLEAQSCLTLCDAMDCSPPGSFVHGIFQARILEWVAFHKSLD